MQMKGHTQGESCSFVFLPNFSYLTVHLEKNTGPQISVKRERKRKVMHFISSASGCLYVRTRLPRYKKPKAHPTRFCLCPKGNSHHCHFLCGLRSVTSFQITVAWVYSVSAQTSFNYPQNKQVCK